MLARDEKSLGALLSLLQRESLVASKHAAQLSKDFLFLHQHLQDLRGWLPSDLLASQATEGVDGERRTPRASPEG